MGAPVAAIAAVAMSRVTGASPLMTQTRVGAGGKLFNMYKIRTMREAFDAEGKPLPDDQRTSRLGVLVRKAKLDEIPQFLNVLKGDMSMVGPRPRQPTEFVAFHASRVSVKPGVTGLYQISGTNKLNDHETMVLETEYARKAKSLSPLGLLAYDLTIIAATPLAILRHADAPHCNVRYAAPAQAPANGRLAEQDAVPPSSRPRPILRAG